MASRQEPAATVAGAAGSLQLVGRLAQQVLRKLLCQRQLADALGPMDEERIRQPRSHFPELFPR